MSHDYFQDLLQRYQRGECTPAERQRVEQWYETLGQEQELTSEEQELLRTTLWQRIAQQTVAAAPAPVPHRGFRSAPEWVHWAAAALVVFGVGLAAWFPQLLHPTAAATAQASHQGAGQLRTYTNTGSAPMHLVLPDSSTVELTAGSSLQYPQQFSGTSRSVQLVGEALFDVTHHLAQPFRVYTASVVTTVLGTRFVVKAYAHQPEALVLVKRGRVRVSPRHSATAVAEPASVEVLPNQQAVYSPSQHTLARELVPEPAVLTPQSFAFNDRPVADVLTALTQAYGVDIEYDKNALAQCTVSVVLSKSSSLFDKLDVLCKTLGATYERADTHLIFHSRGCQLPAGA